MTNRKIALYPGSFDPFTNGHLHVVKTSHNLFDEVIVNIGVNKKKTRNYPAELMAKAMESVFQELGLDNVRVTVYEGATVDLAIQEGVSIIVKGLRDSIDLAEEENQAYANFEASGIDTMYVRAGIAGRVSSSMVRDFIYYDKPIDKYVPGPVLKLINEYHK
ncbi:MAG: pantetheine-phosphate adenylyltransferase [Bacilli bacterium]|nr:pantetheine-phosphate adenylyltransferase [Bacilli bacterium]